MVFRGDGLSAAESAAVFDNAFASDQRVPALVLLLDWLATVRRVVLFESGPDAIEELRCLDLVMKELLMDLRCATGVGPFPEASFEGIIDGMTSEFSAPCADLCREAIAFAAFDVKRLLL